MVAVPSLVADINSDGVKIDQFTSTLGDSPFFFANLPVPFPLPCAAPAFGWSRGHRRRLGDNS